MAFWRQREIGRGEIKRRNVCTRERDKRAIHVESMRCDFSLLCTRERDKRAIHVESMRCDFSLLCTRRKGRGLEHESRKGGD